MKKSAITFLAIVSVTFANAQRLSEKEIPAQVKSTFEKQYPNVNEAKWEKEKGNYEVEFEIKEIDYSVVINPLGKIIETEEEVGLEALPAGVKEYVAQNYATQKIKEVAKITNDKGIVTYEVEIKGKDLIFDNNGKFIKEDENND